MCFLRSLLLAKRRSQPSNSHWKGFSPARERRSGGVSAAAPAQSPRKPPAQRPRNPAPGFPSLPPSAPPFLSPLSPPRFQPLRPAASQSERPVLPRPPRHGRAAPLPLRPAAKQCPSPDGFSYQTPPKPPTPPHTHGHPRPGILPAAPLGHLVLLRPVPAPKEIEEEKRLKKKK